MLGIGWGVAIAVPIVVRARAVPARTRTVTLAGATRPQRRGLPRSRWRIGPVHRVLDGVGVMMRSRSRRRAVVRSVPLALDVLTMAARAGYTPRLAVEAAAQWSPEAVGRVLAVVGERCRLGASFADALGQVGRDEPGLRELADGLAVAERDGAPIADLLAHLADDARAALRRRAEAHARRIPVRLLFPLVFLVLPAFGLLTVVPALVAGLRHT
ncbi:MAG: type II secretion system F family protein [Actinomycetota bacterium]